MGHLTSLSPQKDPFIQKGPSWTYKKKTYGPFLPAQRLFMHLLQNCRARRNRTPLRSCSVKTRTLILKGCQGLRERGGAVSWELFTLSQMISSLARMDCNIESITGCCCRGAFVSGRGAGRRSAAQGRGLLLLYNWGPLGWLSILQELCHSFRLFFYQREQPKGIKRYCMFKLV